MHDLRASSSHRSFHGHARVGVFREYKSISLYGIRIIRPYRTVRPMNHPILYRNNKTRNSIYFRDDCKSLLHSLHPAIRIRDCMYMYNSYL